MLKKYKIEITKINEEVLTALKAANIEFTLYELNEVKRCSESFAGGANFATTEIILKPVEEIDAAAEISETPAQPVEDEVIQVAISDKVDAAADSEESADSEIEFASEGEENLVEESEPSPEVDVSDSVEDEQPLEIVITNQEN